MTSVELYGVKDSLSAENEKYSAVLKSAVEAFQESLEIFNDPNFDSKEGWSTEIKTEISTVFSKKIKYGKAFVVSGELPVYYEEVLRTQWAELNSMPEWNDNYIYSNIIHSLTDHVDIAHYANVDVMVVKSRDFVVARMKRSINGVDYLAAKSIVLPEIPESKKHVRGHIHVSAGRIKPHPNKKDTAIMDYLLCVDLKGMIPTSIVNSSLSKIMQKDHEALIRHLEKRKH